MNNYLNVIKNLSLLYFIFYSFYYSTLDVFNNLTLSLCLVCLISAILYFTRIPAPPKELIEQMLGKDGHGAPENDPSITLRSLGHRGVLLDAPENSLEGFRLCLEHGMKFIEFDVMIAKDGVPVVFHDATLERLCDLNTGIKDLEYASLMNIDIGKKHAYGYKYQNIRIPTLEATVNQLLNDGQIMFIDLKCYKYKIVDVIVKLFQDYPELHSRAIVTSFSPISIYQIRKRNPKIACCLAWRPHVFQQLNCAYFGTFFKQFCAKLLENIYIWALKSFVYYVIGISVILIRKDGISDVIVREWQQRNVRVIAWTVNSPAEKQYFAKILQIPYMTDTITAESSTHSPQNT